MVPFGVNEASVGSGSTFEYTRVPLLCLQELQRLLAPMKLMLLSALELEIFVLEGGTTLLWVVLTIDKSQTLEDDEGVSGDYIINELGRSNQVLKKILFCLKVEETLTT